MASNVSRSYKRSDASRFEIDRVLGQVVIGQDQSIYHCDGAIKPTLEPGQLRDNCVDCLKANLELLDIDLALRFPEVMWTALSNALLMPMAYTSPFFREFVIKVITPANWIKMEHLSNIHGADHSEEESEICGPLVVFAFELLNVEDPTFLRRCGLPSDVVAKYQDGGRKCAYCYGRSKQGPKMKLCARCRSSPYCNSDCQKRHWPKHKIVCVDVAHVADL